MFKNLKGWNTVIFNGSLVAFGTFAELVNYLDIAPLEGFFTGRWTLVPIAIGAINIILHAKTNSAVGKK